MIHPFAWEQSKSPSIALGPLGLPERESRSFTPCPRSASVSCAIHCPWNTPLVQRHHQMVRSHAHLRQDGN